MGRVKAIGSEILGLFVEDARLTVSLAVWIAIAALSRTWWQSVPRLAAIVLFAGFALILCENVVRAARRG
jgi:hypothetical protein